MSDSTLPPPHEQLIRKRIAEIPLLQAVEQRLGLKAILSRYLKPHGNEAISTVDSLMLLVFNIACGRQPLYELDTWVTKLDNGLLSIDWEALTSDPLSNQPQGIFSDDRFGRVLDKLFQTDLASMITDIAHCYHTNEILVVLIFEYGQTLYMLFLHIIQDILDVIILKTIKYFVVGSEITQFAIYILIYPYPRQSPLR